MNNSEQITHQRNIYLDIPMHYESHHDNRQLHRHRNEMTLKLAARFKIIAPTTIEHIYRIPRAKALVHLNKLVEEGLLEMVKTVRSLDGRVYVLTYNGAQYAQDLLGCHLPFRSAKNSAHQFNANSVMHDLMMMHVLQLTDMKGQPLWQGYLTELEFKRLYKANNIRNVDALVRSNGELVALELENSHKTYQTHLTNLQKYSSALSAGLYNKVFFISASERVLQDTKRQHQYALEQMRSSTTKSAPLTHDEIARLEAALVYRTKFCQPLADIFYP